jgi:hypothetical protein
MERSRMQPRPQKERLRQRKEERAEDNKTKKEKKREKKKLPFWPISFSRKDKSRLLSEDTNGDITKEEVTEVSA